MTDLLERQHDEDSATAQPESGRDAAEVILCRHPLFQPLGRAGVARLVDGGRRARHERGERIFARGDVGGQLTILLSGAVKISVCARSGVEIVHNVIQAGESFGEISLLDGQRRSADAIALADCEVMTIGREAALKALAARPDVAANAFVVLCERLRRARHQVEDALFLDTPARLAHVILRKAQPVGGIELRLRATQKQLGEMIGLSRESTNKLLQVWVRSGWVEVEKGGVLVRDPAALSEIADPQGD